MSKLLFAIKIFFSWLCFLFSSIFPKTNTLFVFTGWQKTDGREIFSDNSKYLFLELANNHPDLKGVWISSDMYLVRELQANKYISYHKNSLRGIYYLLRARYLVISANLPIDIWRLTGGAKLIQLWHGDGIKDIKILTPNDPLSWKKSLNALLSPGIYRKPEFYITSSEFTALNFICPSFKVKKTDVRVTGLPRYDVLEKNILDSEIDVDVRLKKHLLSIRPHAKRIILYAPTFRRGKNSAEIFENMYLDRLNQFLIQNNFNFVISLHPKFSEGVWKINKEYSNIYFAEPGWDKYPLVREFDMIVTDYSSTFFEFLYLNKPCIFYAYDYEDYSEKQGLQQTVWEQLPGIKVYNFDELLQSLSTPTNDLAVNNTHARKLFFKYHDNAAAKRIMEEIRKIKV